VTARSGRRSPWATTALLLSTVLTTAGCVAAGVAASPVISALQAVTDRSLERAVPAEQSLVWAASVDTLTRMGFQIDRLQRDDEPRVIEASANGMNVTARLSRMTPSMTRLAVRVESGGFTADKDTAEAIAGQIAAQVKTATSDHRDTSETVRAMDDLRREVQQLRSAVGQGRPAAAPAPDPVATGARQAPANPGFTLGAPAIVVPAGYGFEAPPSPAAASSPPSKVGSAQPPSPAAPGATDVRDIHAVPLAPVGTLSPVQGFTTPSPPR